MRQTRSTRSHRATIRCLRAAGQVGVLRDCLLAAQEDLTSLLRAVSQEDLWGTCIRFNKLKPRSTEAIALIQLEADQEDEH